MECRLCNKPIEKNDTMVTEPDDKGDHTYAHMLCYTADKLRRLLEERRLAKAPRK